MNHSPTAETPEKRAIPTDRGGERDRISFAIYGSYRVVKLGQKLSQFRIEFDPQGHPLPKLRMTGGQSWKPEVKRYMAWKAHVAQSFLEALRKTRPVIYAAALMRTSYGAKPVPSFPEKASMTVIAYYRNRKHADTENVFGSVADALFENDNNLVGNFDFELTDADPRVVVTLELPSDLWTTND